jgi:hypothetical protein
VSSRTRKGDTGLALYQGSLSQEIVAETVAAVLCQLYGFEGYIWHGAECVRHYASGGNPGRAAMRRLSDIQAVLALILEGADA